MESKFKKFFEEVKKYQGAHNNFEETYIYAMGYGAALVHSGAITIDEYDDIFGEVIRSVHD